MFFDVCGCMYAHVQQKSGNTDPQWSRAACGRRPQWPDRAAGAGTAAYADTVFIYLFVSTSICSFDYLPLVCRSLQPGILLFRQLSPVLLCVACLAVSVFLGLSALVPRLASRVTLAVRADARDVIYLSIYSFILYSPSPRLSRVLLSFWTDCRSRHCRRPGAAPPPLAAITRRGWSDGPAGKGGRGNGTRRRGLKSDGRNRLRM